MNNSKLVHLKPSLARAFDRAVRRHDKLCARIVAVGIERADASLLRRLDRLRDRMLDLAGQCQSIECAIDNALDPSQPEPFTAFEDIKIDIQFA